ncbi:MAG TPA: hypothetical protein VMD53_01620 [Rhizomicrobium sp.]|nr:hypothetical protein [Rhizomicrobium sp.]
MRAPLALAARLMIAALLPQSANAQSAASPAPEPDDPTRPTTYFDLRDLYQDRTTTRKSDKVQTIFRGNGTVGISEDWEFGYRLDLPLVASNAITSTDPGGNYEYGVGRPLVSAYLANIVSDRWAYAFGGQVHGPAASGTEFGSGNWDVRPLFAVRAMLPEISEGSFFVPLFRYAQTFAQSYPNSRPASNLQVSPELKIDLADAWFVTLFPSPDVRWNFGARASGQTGRLFLPFDVSGGRSFGNLLTSLEVSVPVVKDYPVYHLKIEARLCWEL